MNIESRIIIYLNDYLDKISVTADVPKKRREQFVTVERTGGSLKSIVLDSATLAVQSWSDTRYNASELAEIVDTALMNLDDDRILKITRNSIYNFPDPDMQMSRYQGVYDVVFYKQ